MSNKITDQELLDLQTLYKESNLKTLALGDIEYLLETLRKELSSLSDKRNEVINNLDSIKESMNRANDALLNKYGKINLNLESGEFTILS